MLSVGAKNLLVFSVIVVILALPARASGEDKCDDLSGSCWSSLNEFQKVLILDGIIQGKKAGYIQGKIIGEDIVSFMNRDRSVIPDNTTYADAIGYFDKLYSFPVNREIPFYKAFLLATLYLRDDDENDRVNLLRLYRDGGEIPFSGRIKKILAPNRVLVAVEEASDVEVVFPQTTSVGLSGQQKADALNFLTSMSNVSYSDDPCSEEPSLVTLTYPIDFFNSDGSLNAEIIVNGRNVCIGGKSISLSEVSSGNGTWKLGQQLLINGLVNYADNKDLKWSAEVEFGAVMYNVFGELEVKTKNDLVQLIEAELSY